MNMDPRFLVLAAALGCFAGAAAIAGYGIIALLVVGAILLAFSIFT